jgi:S-formylglutathione hydrolase FrmB
MRKTILMISITLFSGLAFAGGTVIKTTFYSDSLGEERKVHIYLPEGYDAGGSIHYPAVYYLHGAGYNHATVFGYPIELDKSLNQLINNQLIHPVIVAAADASNPPEHGSWYANSVHPNFGDFEDYIVYDLVEYLEENYRVIRSREKRCIQGLSMGGFGCMKLGLKYPHIYKGLASNAGAFEVWALFDSFFLDQILGENSGPPYYFDPNAGLATSQAFTMCGAFSPNLNNPPYYVDFILDINGNIDPLVKAKWELHNPGYLATLLPLNADLGIYFDCGDLDDFHFGNEVFRDMLVDLKIPHEFQSYPGTHTNKAQERGKIGLEKLHDFMKEKTLVSDQETIPESTGGEATFYLTAGWAHANRNYILLGSISGTDPGTPLPGSTVTLPLNWDFFTNLIVTYANSIIFQDFMGTLSDEGFATAQLNLTPVLGAAGITMHFAYALNNPWDFVSNPVEIQIVP